MECVVGPGGVGCWSWWCELLVLVEGESGDQLTGVGRKGKW